MLKYFLEITINKTRPNWSSIRDSSVFEDYSKDLQIYTIDVPQSCVHQTDIELFADGRVYDGYN